MYITLSLLQVNTHTVTLNSKMECIFQNKHKSVRTVHVGTGGGHVARTRRMCLFNIFSLGGGVLI